MIELYLQWPTNIESRMWSIERRHFQWPWTTPNLVFKVTPFFDTKYLTKATDTATAAIESEQETAPKLSNGTSFKDLEWPLSQISEGRDIIQRQITRKLYKIELWLQWRTNRKSYMVYGTAPFSMTLNDPKSRFQGQIILWRWISPQWLKIQP